MPSTNDVFIEELLNPVRDGEAKNPTIVSVLIILKCTAIKGSELSQVNVYDSVCFCGGDPPGANPEELLLVLCCGHVFHWECIKRFLTGKKSWSDPNEAGEISDCEVESWRDVEVDRNCPSCRTTIIPGAAYDWTGYEDGLWPEQARSILDYFQNPEFGQERIARLNNNDTIAAEITVAEAWARAELLDPQHSQHLRANAELRRERERCEDFMRSIPRPTKLTRRQQTIFDKNAQKMASMEVKGETYRHRGTTYLREPDSQDDGMDMDSVETSKSDEERGTIAREVIDLTGDLDDETQSQTRCDVDMDSEIDSDSQGSEESGTEAGSTPLEPEIHSNSNEKHQIGSARQPVADNVQWRVRNPPLERRDVPTRIFDVLMLIGDRELAKRGH